MRWYDYLICLYLADIISALLIAGSIIVVFPAIFYFHYEEYRRQQVHGGEDD